MIALFLTSLGWPKVLTQNCNKQTNTKTNETEMPFPLYFPIILSCETIICHLKLTAFASVVKSVLFFFYRILLDVTYLT